jgi:hypothetical protein
MTQEDIDLFMESVDIGYTRCNIQPTSGTFFKHYDNMPAVCGITAALINKNGIDVYKLNRCVCFIPEAEKEFNMTHSFINGFIAGFDGVDSNSRYYPQSGACRADYDNGYCCGQEKREKWITMVRSY